VSLAIATTAVARVPATCGELLQGVGEGGPVLVSLPVDLWSTVRVTLTREPVLSVTPSLPKACKALQLALDRVGWSGGALVELGGEIPAARGMGSSTADVAGVIAGVCTLGGVSLSDGELVRLMTQVEPSDSSPLPGLWAIDHVAGTRTERLGEAPIGWGVVAVDSGVAMHTLDVHRDRGAGPRLPAGLLRDTAWNDARAVARLATESALRNQERLPHPAFHAVLRSARRLDAPGICVAHSGSLCAVICDGSAQAREARDLLTAQGLTRVSMLRVQSPGLRVEVEAAPAA